MGYTSKKSRPLGDYAVNGSATYVFTAVDFSTTGGYATIEGPLSLTLDVTNASNNTALYVGITIQTLTGQINVADRTHIGFCPPSKTVTLSPASVPQLGYISGTITSITVTLYYVFSFVVTGVGTTDVQLTYDSAQVVVGPQPLIGIDTRAYAPSILNSTYAYVTLPTGSIGTTIVEAVTSAAYNARIRIKSIHMFASQIVGTLTTGIGTQIIDVSAVAFYTHVIRPTNTRFAEYSFYPPDLIIPVGFKFRIVASNLDGVNRDFEGALLYEYIF